MTTTLLTVLFAVAALLFALALAFVPLRLLMFGMARSVRGTVRDWVQRRRRDRRAELRPTPERRTAAPPSVEEDRRAREERRDADRRESSRREA
ncbi:MAG TPA: hypothetical protein VMS56_14595 [Thermoanaerobaculia bacterium]|nr:hypothetical protein [Thermoanaerobaculia bacterium]